MDIDYDLVFSQMREVFAIHELILDSSGEAIDYRFLDLNPAFEEMTGLSKEAIVGKTVLEVLPGTEALWLDHYAKVVKSGGPRRFEAYTRPLDKWFAVSAFRVAEGCFATFFVDVTERKKLDEFRLATENKLRALNADLERMLEEKDSLVQEVHHRVKNNLQMVISLIELQAEFNIDVSGLSREFSVLQSRVHAIATVHDLFGACGDTETISLREHMSALTLSLLLLSETDFQMAKFELSVDETLCLPVDVAIPISLIVHELIMNSVKHGKKSNKPLNIRIRSVVREDGVCELRISDDGDTSGPSSAGQKVYQGVGSLLIEGLSDQIKASVKIDRTKGYATTLCFPLLGAGKPRLP